jgi:hypothetical protein
VRKQLILVIVMVVWCFSGGLAHGADTTISYQGRLDDGGSAADGPYDMTFSLWNASAGGAQVGSSLALLDVPVSEGLFTVELDFGADAFDNSARWLEIVVEGTTLSPRQPITRAPYAIQTRGIFVSDGSSFVGVGRKDPVTSAEQFGVHTPAGDNVYGGMYMSTEGEGGWPFYGYAAGQSGDMWHYYDGSTGKWHVYNGDVRLTIGADGRVGIGTTSPSRPLDVQSAAEVVTILGQNQRAGGTAISGVHQGNTGVGVQGVVGDGSEGVGVHGISLNALGTGVRGDASGGVGLTYGVFGASTSSNGYDVFAGGNGINYGASSSRRWKENVRRIPHALEMIGRLRGVYFDWDAEHGGRHDIGMIAEEVGAVLPEIVAYEDNGVDAHGMDYSKLTPVLVEAVNAMRSESNRRLAEKDDEINELRQQLADLQQVVERLAWNQEKEIAR